VVDDRRDDKVPRRSSVTIESKSKEREEKEKEEKGKRSSIHMASTPGLTSSRGRRTSESISLPLENPFVLFDLIRQATMSIPFPSLSFSIDILKLFYFVEY